MDDGMDAHGREAWVIMAFGVLFSFCHDSMKTEFA